MIPDFLQNLRGVPGSMTRPGSSEPAVPADPATPAPDFTRTLREQQSARPPERLQPASSVAKSSRGSDAPGGRLESDPAPESRTTGNDQAEVRSESSEADTSRQSVSAAKDDAGQQVDRAGDDDALSALTGSSNVQQSATTKTDSQGESATRSVIGRQQAVAASDSAAASGDADAGSSVTFGESSVAELTEVAAGFLVDGFSTQIETTTATNDGLQLEVDENESSNEADLAVASDDDNSLSSAVEILVIESGTDPAQPLVLGSLVSIAVAQSAKFRIQQTGAEQGGSANEPAADRPTVPGGAVIPGQASLDKQAVDDELPTGSNAASPSTVETPVLPSLVAAKHGRQPIRRLPVTGAEGVTEVSRSQATPQTLSVNLPASGGPVIRELKPDTAAVDSSNGQVAAETPQSVLPVSGIESESVAGEPVADHSELAGEPSSDGNRAVGTEPELTQDQTSVEPAGLASDELQITGDPVDGAGRQVAAQPAAQQPSDFARSNVSDNSATPEVVADESATLETTARPSEPVATEQGRSSQVSGPADPQVSRTTEREPSVSRQAEQQSDVSGRNVNVADAVGSDQSGEQSARVAAASGPVDAKSTQRSRRASSDERRTVQPDVVDVQTPTVGNEFAVESGQASEPLIADASGQRHVPAASVASSDSAVVSVSASGDVTGEQTAGRTGPDGGAISGDLPAVSQGASVAAAGDRGTSLRGDVADAPVIGGPDRFLSPNVQRALSAIQSAADGGSRLRVQLNPVELGSLLVEIEQTPQGIVARLEVGNAAAHRVLVDSLSDLQQALARHQSPVDRIDVVLNEARTETSRQQREQQQQRGQQEQRGQHQQRGDAESERRRQRDFDQLTDDLDDRGPTVEAA